MNPAAEPDRLARAPPGWSSPVAVTSRMRKRGNNGSTRVSDEQWQAGGRRLAGRSRDVRPGVERRSRKNSAPEHPVDSGRRDAVPERVPRRRFHARSVPGAVHAEPVPPVAARGEVRELLRLGQRMQSRARDNQDRPIPAPAVVAGDADRHLAVAPDGLSDVREVAAQVRISNSVHREMASFGCARRRKPRWVSRRLRIPGDDHPGPDRLQR